MTPPARTTPAIVIGYPADTMVYYADGHRHTDFMKMGIAPIAPFCALSMFLIPHVWPLHA